MNRRMVGAVMVNVSVAVLLLCVSGAWAQDEGLLPVPDYSGGIEARSHLSGDWGGTRQDWAERGVTLEIDWTQFYQDVVDGGLDGGSEWPGNLDYRVNLDLMRMGAVPGALVAVRGQSRFGRTVNEETGLLLPANTYAGFPLSSDADGDVDFALTELNWTQFLSERIGLLAGKITTMSTANEFLGGQGRTQFMNFQFNFSAALAQLAPYSTLAAGLIGMPNEDWTVSTMLMNLNDASSTTGFDDIGDGTTWATMIDYLGSLNSLPGGGSFGVYYAFDADLAGIGGLNIDPGTGESSVTMESDGWALAWSGWQYLFAEEGTGSVDPRNSKQDLEGLGVFAMVGIGDEDTNPVRWSIAGGLSGRGSIPGRDADTWGAGYFYNDVQDLDIGSVVAMSDSTQGVELYYDIQLVGAVNLTLNAQWTKSGFSQVEDASVLGVRLNASF